MDSRGAIDPLGIEKAIGEIDEQIKHSKSTPKKFTGIDLEVLRSEVMRKNSMGEGLYPTDFAYTANHFVIYENYGECYFRIVRILDLEKYKEQLPIIREEIECGEVIGTAKAFNRLVKRIRSKH